MALDPAYIHNAKMRRRSNRNLILPWSYDLTQPEWQKVAGATAPSPTQLTFPADTSAAAQLVFDPAIDPRLNRIMPSDGSNEFLFTGFVRLDTVLTGVEPYNFHAVYNDSIQGDVFSDILTLSIAANFTPFKLRFTPQVQRTHNIMSWSQDYDVAATWILGAPLTVEPNTPETLDPLGGDQATKVTNLGAAIYQTAIPCLPSTVYTYSLWAKRAATNPATFVNIQVYDETTPGFIGTGSVQPITDEWTVVAHTFTTNPGQSLLRVYADRSGDAGDAYFWGSQTEIGAVAHTYQRTAIPGVPLIGLQSADGATSATLGFNHLSLTELWPTQGG